MSDSPLSSSKIVITRPLAQAQVWRDALLSLGAQVVCIPVLAIEPLRDAAAQQTIKNHILKLDEYHKAIFVSQNAVEYAWGWIDQYWPQLPVDLDFFAIGSTTAKVLQQRSAAHHVAVLAAGAAMNSEELLALPNLQQVEQNKIIIFRGCGGRPTLADELSKRGARVDLCELYSRTLPATAFAEFKAFFDAENPLNTDVEASTDGSNSAQNCVLSVHSGESLENLDHVIAKWVADKSQVRNIRALPLLVPGSRVAELAEKLGYANVITAGNATDAAMTQALIDWQQKK